MGKLAVITEKESVARDVVAVLGGFTSQKDCYENDRYVVMWAIGHILSLPSPEEIDEKYKRWMLQDLPILPEKFELKPAEKMKGRLDMMAKAFRRSDVEGIVNACDAGREGELIFREIVEFTGTDKPILRLWLQSMTPAAIRDGFANLEPGERYDGLADAAWCRSEADWLVGMNATRAVTKRLQSRKQRGVWSAGRVQTPTLALLVDHEFRILGFEPRPYWQILARFQAPDHDYPGTWIDPEWKGNPEEGEKEDRLFDRERAEKLLEKLRGKPGKASETRKPSRESAPLLFDLTTLQREANRRFGYSARRTLQAAQRLYEAHKVLTYPRTDSKHLPEDYHAHVDRVLDVFSDSHDFGPYARRLKAEGLKNTGKIFDNTKVSDHFAIIPTGEVPKHLEGDDARIFDLVMRRFLSAFHPPAVWNQVERKTEVEEELFRSRSRTLQVPGWREVYGSEENPDAQLPPLIPGEDTAENVAVRSESFEMEEKRSRPPGRINEGRLLGLMERAGKDIEDEELSEALAEKGLGTPATRADTIENLIQKEYVQRLRGALKPTAKGVRLIDFLHRIDSSGLASAELTGEWEKHLGEVEQGKMARRDFMKGISDFTAEVVGKIKEFEYEDLYAKEPPIGICPACGQGKVIEFFWGYRCERNERNGNENGEGDPGCDFIIWKEINGRYMDRKTARTLLEKRRTAEIPGFVNFQGMEYEAVLEIDESNQVRVSGSTAGAGDEAEERIDSAPLCPCKQGEDCQVIETSSRYVCERLLEGGGKKAKDVNSCGLVLPKQVCKREIPREEAEEYFQAGRIGPLEGFISKRGRPFPAILYIKEDNGRHGFEFIPREKKTTEKKTVKKAAKKTTKKAAKKTSKKTAKKAVKKTARKVAQVVDEEPPF